MKEEIEEKLRSILRKFVNNEAYLDNLNSEINLDGLGINSISFIKIIVQIESEFDIEFDENDLNSQRFETLSDIVLYVENRIADIV